jgi:hypothetical protein
MKRIFLLGVLTMAGAVLVAQDASVPDPEFINQVYFLDKDHKLQDLEKTQAELKTKSGIAGGKQLYIINGAKSSVTVPAADATFVVSNGASGFSADPSQQFELLRFDVKKNNREGLSVKYGGIGKPKMDEGQNHVKINYKKLKEGVFGIVPEQPLAAGEYAFINKLSMQGTSMKMDAYAFSVQ